MSDKKGTVKSVIELLEEDDEFEEFESDWNVTNDEEPQLWQDDWDDDNVADEFTDQLRIQLEQQRQISTTTQKS